MCNVDVIYNKEHDRFYIGQTENLKTRLIAHNNKTFKNCFTARFDGEWQLIYKEEVATRNEALVREKQLKSFRGRQFVKSFIPR
ncbi:endonuclease [Candidatus Berkelbacteria bacterium CG10_big_fil_rev_8_21_14_0_10_43_13]|uniref:Endonuclease n=1 Tax=Candidatus Berkelbacteria bacterium CG10_big_fil_rev_8_21_14_0_10_43_13 TaxID=1974514 RepID=A0A2H0W7D6_9BACT|nr:MAG: endonuclease [Candidatus Berkelbacteria bacterium CG10_big_fil_rev_8_21_14_0_10_43_13]